MTFVRPLGKGDPDQTMRPAPRPEVRERLIHRDATETHGAVDYRRVITLTAGDVLQPDA